MIIADSKYKMIKAFKILLFALIIFHSPQSFAQSNDEPFKKFQIVAGVTAANMNFNKGVPAPASHISPSFKTGFTFGVLINFSLADNILKAFIILYFKSAIIVFVTVYFFCYSFCFLF